MKTIIDIISSFFQEKFFLSPQERIVKQLIKKINKGKAKLITKDKKLTNSFFLQIYNILNPFLPLIKTLEEEMITKKGRVYMKYLYFTSLSDNQSKNLKDLEQDQLDRYISRFPEEKTTALVQEKIQSIKNEFLVSTKNEVQNNYDFLKIFSTVTKIGIEQFFKELDPKFDIHNLDFYKPSFKSIEGVYFVNDLKILNNVLNSLNFKAEYASFFEKFGNFKYIKFDKTLYKIASKYINNLCRTEKLEMLVNALSKKMNYKTKIIKENLTHNIIDDELGTFEKQTIQYIITKYNQIKQDFLNIASKRLFDNSKIEISHFNQELNDHMIKMSLPTFKYIEHLTYVNSYYKSYYPKVKEILNKLVIQGNFRNEEIKTEFNNSYEYLEKIYSQIKTLEIDLKEDKKIGKLLYKAIERLELDPRASIDIDGIVTDINKSNKKMIIEFLMNLKKISILFNDIYLSFHSKSKNILVNIDTFNGDSTNSTIEDIYSEKENMLLLFNIVRVLSNLGSIST